jgi:hypothetical protein
MGRAERCLENHIIYNAFIAQIGHALAVRSARKLTNRIKPPHPYLLWAGHKTGALQLALIYVPFRQGFLWHTLLKVEQLLICLLVLVPYYLFG